MTTKHSKTQVPSHLASTSRQRAPRGSFTVPPIVYVVRREAKGGTILVLSFFSSRRVFRVFQSSIYNTSCAVLICDACDTTAPAASLFIRRRGARAPLPPKSNHTKEKEMTTTPTPHSQKRKKLKVTEPLHPRLLFQSSFFNPSAANRRPLILSTTLDDSPHDSQHDSEP